MRTWTDWVMYHNVESCRDVYINYHLTIFVLVQKAGIDMQMYEVIELLDHLEKNASNMGEADGVNYK